jgi:hypothetical protein
MVSYSHYIFFQDKIDVHQLYDCIHGELALEEATDLS